uniref:Uncharacterized protein n=1 Tax=Vespula pensylvanica TaxID=30213 RepID=A0A834UE89_VESPE|nr:hypothetical protein H0235_002930 [Vespula pensylvanica]
MENGEEGIGDEKGKERERSTRGHRVASVSLVLAFKVAARNKVASLNGFSNISTRGSSGVGDSGGEG